VRDVCNTSECPCPYRRLHIRSGTLSTLKVVWIVRPLPPFLDEFVGFFRDIALVERVKWGSVDLVSQLRPVNAEHIAPDLSVSHVSVLLELVSNETEEVVVSHRLFSCPSPTMNLAPMNPKSKPKGVAAMYVMIALTMMFSFRLI